MTAEERRTMRAEIRAYEEAKRKHPRDEVKREKLYRRLLAEKHGINPPGRPPVGPNINVRMPQDLVDWIDVEAARRGESRAAYVRNALEGMRWAAEQLAEAETNG